MRAQFVRGAKTREELLDTILGRKITIEMPSYDIEVNSKGNLDTKHEETRYFKRQLDKAKVQYEVTGQDDTYVYVQLSGTKDQLLKILPMWDAMGRDEEELKNDLADWEGDQETIDNELF